MPKSCMLQLKARALGEKGQTIKKALLFGFF
jgi:hypothetical protein